MQEFSESNLKELCYQIIEPKFQKNITDWLFDARPNERKGLFIISKIIKHKGEMAFKDKLDQKPEQEELSMENAYKRYQKRALTSTYIDEFCLTVDPKFKYNNILKYKKFDFVNYSEIIIPKFRDYITKWALLETAEQYKEYVLDFVRSFFSTCKSNLPNTTMYKHQFQNFKQGDHFSKHAAFIPENKSKPIRLPTLEELREHFGLDELKKKYENKPPIKFNDNIQNMEEIRKMKRELVNGQKNLLKGVYADTNLSHYKETFRKQHDKYKWNYQPDFFTSGVKGKIPDPYEMNRVKSHRHINSALKGTVKNILFK